MTAAPFSGGSASACQIAPTPGVDAPTPPPDVAADVSSTQNVEMLNQGLWVFDKSGTIQQIESLYQFWCGTSGADGEPLASCPAGGNPNELQLSDTQVAFDPFGSKWLATTLAADPNSGRGHLLFAISNTPSAVDGVGAWERYDIPVCTGGNYIAEQPILGYSADWAAVDVLCGGGSNGFGPGSDALVLIPNGSILNPPLTATPNQTIITPPLFASRPSRDVSGTGSAYSQLILASSQFDPNQSSPPHAALYGIGASPSPTPISTSSDAWGFSGYGSKIIPLAPQLGCTIESSNCMVSVIDQSRIQQATVQYNPTTGDHYLLTSFTAGYQSGAEALYYIDELETGTWVGEFTGTGSSGWVPTYTTITSEQDFDINATATSFTSNGFPYTIGFAWHGFRGTEQPAGLPETAFAGSSGAFTGQNTCPTPTPTAGASPTPTPSPSATPTPAPVLQRWGDYNSLIWDPSLASSSGEPNVFWSVAEFSQGGTDQSSAWTPLNDSLPYYVNYSVTDSECPNGIGSTCAITIKAPAGVVPGDVLVVSLDMGRIAKALPVAPAGWSIMPVSNQNGAQYILSKDSCGVVVTSWLLTYISGSQPGDTGSYKFTHYDNGANTCADFYNAEMEAFMTAYHGVGQDLSKYTVYGFPDSVDSNQFSVGPVTPPAETQLVTLLFAPLPESGEDSTGSQTLSISGSPGLTVETPATNQLGYLAADVGAPNAGQSFGPYSASVNTNCSNLVGCLWYGWQVAIPEQ